jgi:hypothetical protein
MEEDWRNLEGSVGGQNSRQDQHWRYLSVLKNTYIYTFPLETEQQYLGSN